MLSRRELYIAIGTAIALALLALDRLLLTPYLERRSTLAADRQQAVAQLSQAQSLFDRQRKLRPIWATIQKSGLKADASAAESQAMHAILSWTQSAGVDLTTLKPERTTQEGPFQVSSFHVTATGPMAAVSRLLWAMETPDIPIRVNDVQISPRKEGADDLSVQLSVSTLSRPEKKGAAPAPPASGRGGQS